MMNTSLSIDNVLLQLNKKYPLCSLCVSRFFYLPSCNNHDNNKDNLKDQENLFIDFNLENVICLACLGDLKRTVWSHSIPSQLIDSFISSCYDPCIRNYSLNIILPRCHYLRQRIIYELLKDELFIIDPSSQLTLKNIDLILTDNIKLAIRDEIISSLSLDPSFSPSYLSNAPLQITVELFSLLTGKICSLIWSAPIKPLLPSSLQRHPRFRKILMESKTSMNAFLKNLSKEFIFQHCKINEFLQWKSAVSVKKISLVHSPLFIAGRYIKNSRNVSQSPWSVKKFSSSENPVDHLDEENDENALVSIELSVSGIIGDFLQNIFRASETKFSAAGREDADVRMLGFGRPFIIEVINPKLISIKVSENSQNWSESIETLSDGSVQVPQFYQVDGRLANNLLKEGEETKTKIYRCVIWSSIHLTESVVTLLNELENVEIRQKTPIRVIQRRANLLREKMLYKFSSQYVNREYFILYLSAQAGTYIKEFVHGNFGRTRPSLGDLMFKENDALDLIELDVLHIDLPEWPPSESIIS